MVKDATRNNENEISENSRNAENRRYGPERPYPRTKTTPRHKYRLSACSPLNNASKTASVDHQATNEISYHDHEKPQTASHAITTAARMHAHMPRFDASTSTPVALTARAAESHKQPNKISPSNRIKKTRNANHTRQDP